ncbi:MAG: response regulator [Bacteroidaceae bacterium]|nr:response regulator [Bacteroidaceae bacterium]
MKTRIFLTLFLGLWSLRAAAFFQGSDFLIVDSRNGLSQNNVKSITQDDYGFIWLGTKNGLCRYDGRATRTVYVHDDATGIANQNISALDAEEAHLIWVGTDEGLFLYDTSSDLFRHIDTPAQDGQRMTNWVGEIRHDHQGNVWVVVPGEGLFKIECAGRRGAADVALAPVHHYPNPGKANDSHFTCCTVAPHGEVWASGWNIGLWCYNPKTDRFDPVRQDATGRSLLGIQTNTLTALPDGSLVMAVQDGHLLLYSPLKGELTENPWYDFSTTLVRGASAYDDQLLVGTYDGLFRIGTATGEVTHYRHDRNNLRSLSDDIIYTTFRDREGGFWIGTMFGGAAYLPAREQMFVVVRTDSEGHSLSSDRIREMTTDGARNLWVCTEDGGINHIDLQSGRITPYVGQTASKDDDFTICLTYFQGRLYAGINKAGLKVMDVRTGQTTLVPNATLGLPGETSIYDVCIDPQGNLWLATDQGVWLTDRNLTAPVKALVGMENFWVYDILHDRRGNVWMAMMGGGLMRMDGQSGLLHRYQPDAKNAHSLSSGSVSAVFEDRTGHIWLSTDRGGICRYRPETDDFQRFSTEEGLPDNVAYNMLEDNHGRLWFGTNRGLVQLNPETGHIHLFTTKQGLPSNQFNYKSALSTDGNTLFFGTINGLVLCQPEKVAATREPKGGQPSRLVLTRLTIDGVDMTPQTPRSPLKTSIMETERIVLPYKHANLNLDVALLSFSSGMETVYEYLLEPIDNEWHPVPEGGLSLASLASGTYTLRLRSSNLSNENVPHEERSLVITVRPPLWRQWWAVLLYVVALASLAGLWFWWYRRRKETQFQERQRIFTIEKEKELSEKRIQYFTEIAHEIRTPLTLINGPLEAIEKTGVDNPRVARNLSVIHQNTNRLLNLASQLLDFQKVGSGGMKPQMETVNVSELLRDTMERFEPTYNLRGKSLVEKHIEPAILALIDREAVTKILSNLLNNALKYGQSRCEVELTADPHNFRLAVFSDGAPIPPERREAIFDPFVQLRERKQVAEEPVGGVGIGLALCRSLAKMHSGTLTVEVVTASGEAAATGNSFVLSLPLGEVSITDNAPNAPSNNTLPADTTLHDEGLLTKSHVRGANVLLVEDEEGIREFLGERLREDFIVEVAENGQAALEKLKAGHFDLVITDIMMPVMDGIELCRNIKQDIELSHIPVIFLTAKNDTDSKIAGLQVGAEAYIEKPFAWDFLHMQIVSLLSNRQREREAFAKRPFFPMNGMQMSREDEDFMNRTLEVINKNLSDENFNVEAMASALCMSRSSLLRKIKTLFDMPPLDFIRLIRLKKAADLIQDGRYRMGEISTMVGFSNHSYFSKLFCRQFGMTPKDFERQIEEQRAKTKDLRQK